MTSAASTIAASAKRTDDTLPSTNVAICQATIAMLAATSMLIT